MNITVTFSESELKTLSDLLDAAVRASGLQGAVLAVPLVHKLQEAVKAASELPKAVEGPM